MSAHRMLISKLHSTHIHTHIRIHMHTTHRQDVHCYKRPRSHKDSYIHKHKYAVSTHEAKKTRQITPRSTASKRANKYIRGGSRCKAQDVHIRPANEQTWLSTGERVEFPLSNTGLQKLHSRRFPYVSRTRFLSNFKER